MLQLSKNFKYLLFALAFMCISFKCDNDEFIEWKKEKKLTWDDFRGVPDTCSKFGAISFIHTSISYVKQNYGISNLTVVTKFSKTKSWVKKKDQNAEMLNHEQGHFNIAEFYSRLLRIKINFYLSNQKYNIKTIEHSIDSLFFEVSNLKNKKQIEYDDETLHGRLKGCQLEWDRNFNAELLND